MNNSSLVKFIFLVVLGTALTGIAILILFGGEISSASWLTGGIIAIGLTIAYLFLPKKAQEVKAGSKTEPKQNPKEKPAAGKEEKVSLAEPLIALGVAVVILIVVMIATARPDAERRLSNEPVYIPEDEEMILVSEQKPAYIWLSPGQRSKRVLIQGRSFTANYLNVPPDTRVDQVTKNGLNQIQVFHATAGVDNSVGGCEWIVIINKSTIPFTTKVSIH